MDIQNKNVLKFKVFSDKDKEEKEKILRDYIKENNFEENETDDTKYYKLKSKYSIIDNTKNKETSNDRTESKLNYKRFKDLSLEYYFNDRHLIVLVYYGNIKNHSKISDNNYNAYFNYQITELVYKLNNKELTLLNNIGFSFLSLSVVIMLVNFLFLNIELLVGIGLSINIIAFYCFFTRTCKLNNKEHNIGLILSLILDGIYLINMFI